MYAYLDLNAPVIVSEALGWSMPNPEVTLPRSLSNIGLFIIWAALPTNLLAVSKGRIVSESNVMTYFIDYKDGRSFFPTIF